MYRLYRKLITKNIAIFLIKISLDCLSLVAQRRNVILQQEKKNQNKPSFRALIYLLQLEEDLCFLVQNMGHKQQE